MRKGYEDQWEQLEDELKWLDLKLQIAVYRMQDAAAPVENSWKGLVVMEQEVLQLLQRDDPVTGDDVEHGVFAELAELEARMTERLHAKRGDVFLPLSYLASVFGLSWFEFKCLMIGLAAEIDKKYEKVFGYLHDDISRKVPTVSLALQLLCSSVREGWQYRALFSSQGTLGKYCFQLDGTEPLPSRTLRVDERIVRWVMDGEVFDHKLRPYAQIHYPTETLPPLLWEEHVEEQLAGFTEERLEQTVFLLRGPSGSGKKLHARHFCQKIDSSLLIVDLRLALQQESALANLLRVVVREATLHQAALGFANLQVLFQGEESNGKLMSQLLEVVQAYEGPVFFFSEEEWKSKERNRLPALFEWELSIAPEEQRSHLWEQVGVGYSLQGEIDWQVVASTFRFTIGQMERALKRAEITSKRATLTPMENLFEACYEQIQHRLEQKATRLKPKATLRDLILPPDLKEQLENAVARMKLRSQVFGEWGFEEKLSYGKGLSLLFAGPPGTGKTMAAEVVAKELQLQIYKIDLSQVISKYIGETEKNLHEIFSEARLSSSILFFDEADALFGKRSEVKASNDKYANVETAYLLQKMEEYDGVSVLATNYLQNLDEAFLRRLSLVVQFPFPDARQREAIWQHVFPAQTPLDEDIDFAWLADTFELAGGNIKNIAVSASFLAAKSGEAVSMRHIVKVGRLELGKMGKLVPGSVFEEYLS